MFSRIANSLVVLFVLLFVGAVLKDARSSKPKPATLPTKEIEGALYCIQERYWTLDSIREFSGGAYFRVKYVHGIYDPADKENELHLVVYSKDNRWAWLYELYVEKKAAKVQFLIGNIAKLRREEEGWGAVETHGGIYSYGRVERLADTIEATKEVVVPYLKKPPTNVKCIE